MVDVQALVNDFVLKLKRRKIEGSHTSVRQTTKLLQWVVSQQLMPYTNQTTALIDVVKAIGEKLIAANPVRSENDSSVKDNYLGEAMKMRNLLEEFKGNPELRRPVIMSVQEHVFTGSKQPLNAMSEARPIDMRDIDELERELKNCSLEIVSGCTGEDKLSRNRK